MRCVLEDLIFFRQYHSTKCPRAYSILPPPPPQIIILAVLRVINKTTRTHAHAHTNLIKHNGEILSLYICIRDTRWRSWFKHCATRRESAGSIPDQVIRIFVNIIFWSHYGPEMSTTNISRCVKAACV